MRRIPALLLLVSLLAGCSGGRDDIVVNSKEIRRESLSQSVAGDAFGSAAGSTIEHFVTGQVQNKGGDEARNVELTFYLSGGGQNFALVANIPSIPPGKTVDFRTRGVMTPHTLQFRNDRDVEITMGK